jgi:hypothetical protein
LPSTLPPPPRDIAPALVALLQSDDVPAALQALPEETQTQIVRYLSDPKVQDALRKILPPEALAQFPALQQSSAPAMETASPAQEKPEISQAAPQKPVPAVQAQMPAAQEDILPFFPAPARLPSAASGSEAAGKPAAFLQKIGLGTLIPLIEAVIGQTATPAATQMPAPQQPKIPMPVISDLTPYLPQNLFKIEILHLGPPAAGPAAIPAGQPAPAAPTQGKPFPAVQKGIVESVTPDGHAIIRAAGGQHFVLKNPVSVEPGTTVEFTVHPMSPAEILGLAPLPAVIAPEKDLPPLEARLWPALQESLRTLDNAGGEAAQLMRATIPAPANAAKMTPTTLFFLAALRLGTVESWLGGNVLQSLRQNGRKDLADTLDGDFARLSSQSKTPLSGEWRAISLPVLHDEHLSQIQFYVRRQNDPEDNGQDEGPRKTLTRFIVNLSLSRMGDMQLDGLLRQKRLDMILRTQDALPFGIRQDIMQRYTAALEQTQMQGGISFQAKKAGWVSPGQAPAGSGTIA